MLARRAVGYLHRFQSHAGSIEGVDDQLHGAKLCECFNPTLVRLRVGGGNSGFVAYKEFQSRAGSIEGFLRKEIRE